MAKGKHSYVPFYPSDWLGGTARMTRLHRSVYFDVCCYIWDKAEPCPETELAIMLADLPDWREIVDLLVAAGKLDRTPDGSVVNSRALSEAEKARDLWQRKSGGGKAGAAKTNTHDRTPAKTPVKSAAATPAMTPGGIRPGVPTQNQNQINNSPPSEDADASFDPVADLPEFLRKETNGAAEPSLKDRVWGPAREWLGKATGEKDRAIRSYLGKLVSEHGEAKTLEAILAAQRNAPHEPKAYVARILKPAEPEKTDWDQYDPKRTAHQA